MLVKDIEITLKKKKTKRGNMISNDVKISRELKRQRLAEYRKRYCEMLKRNCNVSQ